MKTISRNRSKNDEELIFVDEWLPIFIEEMKKGKSLKFSPWGYSMYPFLVSKRDDVIVEIPRKKLERGDICLYRRFDGTYVLHSLFKKDEKGVFFLGDNQITVEGPLLETQVIGVVTAFIRKGKRIECNDKLYVLVHMLWMNIRLVRPIILSTWKFYRKISGKEKKSVDLMNEWISNNKE